MFLNHKKELKKMTEIRDKEILKNIIFVAGNHKVLVDYFLRVAEEIENDTSYWQMAATVWIASGRSDDNLDKWREIFSSTRRNRHKMMKKKDRKSWRSLPRVFTAYRASRKGEDISRMISWTIDKSIADKFAKTWVRNVVSKTFKKTEVIAYFDRRGEKEILVL
jgi:hypothetical protein